MLLALDIGNSSITVGLIERPVTLSPADRPTVDRPTVVYRAKISADTRRSADEYAVTVHGLLTAGGYAPMHITAVAVSSVVPQLTHTLHEAIGRLCDAPILTIGSGVRTGISLKVDDPAQLGADIVTNAAAAVGLYGAPVLFLDIGTATVLGAVNGQRALCGVSIAPGPATALEGLRASAAQIPYIDLKKPASVLGKNTAASAQSGILIGTACMVDGLIDRALEELSLSSETPVVITGGLAPLILPACRHAMHHEPDLTLLGLCHIHAATAERTSRKAKDAHT